MKNTSFKKKLAARFLRAINNLTNISSPSPFGRRIRAAAYASMASTVGPRRAWSRALLKKIRIRGRRRRRVLRRNPRNGGLKDLSQVVPGGMEMDSCRLLNETAHYIKCLTAQVQIMRDILHTYSSRL